MMRMIKIIVLSFAIVAPQCHAFSYYDYLAIITQRCNALCSDFQDALDGGTLSDVLRLAGQIERECYLLNDQNPNWCPL